MILSIIVCVIILGIYIWYAIDEGFWSFGEGFLSFFIVIGGWLLTFLVLLFVSHCVTSCVTPENKTYEITKTNKIEALKDNPDITGHYYLFSGYKDEELYYYYAENTGLGIHTDKVRADKSYIIYDNESPRIEYYEAKKFKNWWHYIYAIPNDSYYKVYVPEGTITDEYNIDLE